MLFVAAGQIKLAGKCESEEDVVLIIIAHPIPFTHFYELMCCQSMEYEVEENDTSTRWTFTKDYLC